MISLFGSDVGNDERIAIEQVLKSGWLGCGRETETFETMISEHCGGGEFVFLNSGSNALHMALHLLDLPEGSEVLMPSFTWVACASAARLCGLRPVFCDVDRDTCNIRPEDVEAKITKNTSAIMVVHYAGKPVDLDGFRGFNLPIVEDAAHAIDSLSHGARCGTLGNVGVFSFDPVKNITTGEGGGVFLRCADRAKLARSLRNCGVEKTGFDSRSSSSRWWEHKLVAAFPKMLNTDLAAAMGIVQLQRLEEIQNRRRQIWNRYQAELQSAPWAQEFLTTPPDPEEHERHSYFTYLVKIHSSRRDQLSEHLSKKGIYTSLRYHPLHLNPFFAQETGSSPLPNCEWLNDHALNLPIHPSLSDSDQDKILAELEDLATS